jgi:tRNA-dihydrouridine synthase A
MAPMMRYTDRHFRFMLRRISKNVRLYTEMVTTGALLHGDAARFLEHDDAERPVALQLGGGDPRELAACARLGEQAGFDEINLNVGCPSDRVRSARIGACLMAEPALVASCIRAMRDEVAIPVTAKTRTGIDDRDSYDDLAEFVHALDTAGCSAVLVHARKAWLNGLSPRENREVPPLRWDRVHRLKRDFPDLTIVINGGIGGLAEVQGHLDKVDGVMIGRRAYADPHMLAATDRALFTAEHGTDSRIETIRGLFPYIEEELARGTYLKHMTRHLLGFFHGEPGAKQWRRYLSENAFREGADIRVVRAALREVESCQHSRAG